MKTAEECLDMITSAYNCPDVAITETIRLIQADAVKHGMTLAAEIADNYDGKGMDGTSYYDQRGDAAMTKHDIQKEIITARDNFKLP